MTWHDVRHDDKALLQDATVVCGCGGGSAVREVLPALLDAAPRLLLDADALNAIAADLRAGRSTGGARSTRRRHRADAASARSRAAAR